MSNPCQNGSSSIPVTIPGPSGNLEGIVDCAHDSAEKSAVGCAVICHPHPVYGGTMQNKVVHTVAKTLAAQNFSSLRFNFRGVGLSAGSYNDGIGEVDDALAAAGWLQDNQSGLPLVLAGFSFGSFVAMQAVAKLKPAALITVAPPVRMFDFDGIDAIDCPWLLIQGDEDEVVDADSVVNWARTLKTSPQLEIIHGASHFFHGKLIELRSVCEDFLQGDRSQSNLNQLKSK